MPETTIDVADYLERSRRHLDQLKEQVALLADHMCISCRSTMLFLLQHGALDSALGLISLARDLKEGEELDPAAKHFAFSHMRKGELEQLQALLNDEIQVPGDMESDVSREILAIRGVLIGRITRTLSLVYSYERATAKNAGGNRGVADKGA